VVLRSAAVLAGALTLVASPGASDLVAAAPAPEPEALPRVQAACDSARWLRVTTERGVFQASKLALESDAVLIPPPPGRVALVTVGDPREPARRIPWAGVQSIQSERSHTVRDALVAGAVGLALGTLLVQSTGPDRFTSSDNVNVALAAAMTVSFAGVGMLYGMTHPDLHPIYP
jgi:hypothetical protein